MSHSRAPQVVFVPGALTGAERAQVALDQMRPLSFAGFGQTIETAAWTQLPTVSIRAADDLVPRAVADGFLQACVDVVEIPAGHGPHWSRPALVTQTLPAGFAAGTARWPPLPTVRFAP